PVPAEAELRGEPEDQACAEGSGEQPPERVVDGELARAGAARVGGAGGGGEGEGGEEGGGGLDRYRRDEGRSGGGLSAGEERGDCEHREQHHQAVVVGAADDVDEDQGVEGDEGRGAGRVEAAG